MNASTIYPRLGHDSGYSCEYLPQVGLYDQASIRLFDQYVSNPVALGKLKFRQFIATSATMSMDRTPNDFLVSMRCRDWMEDYLSTRAA